MMLPRRVGSTPSYSGNPAALRQLIATLKRARDTALYSKLGSRAIGEGEATCAEMSSTRDDDKEDVSS